MADLDLDVRFVSFQRSPDVIKITINGKRYEGHATPFQSAKFRQLLKYSDGKALTFIRKYCILEHNKDI
ncbi:MAG: hypothetical protein M0R17_01815 [Candidatus Omnitrophica bacterium]|jgi:hypothetical protein|nr:hypothetical protein [Candidatus Omnitrophota bacterium]